MTAAPAEPRHEGHPTLPPELVDALARLDEPWLVALDLDGTLAPIVTRPEDSRLAPGAAEALEGLVSAGRPVLVVSGRSLDDLRRFPWPAGVRLAGSHGLELDGEGASPLDAGEASTLAHLRTEAEALAAAAPGCWVEHKPFSLVLHTRTATDRDAAARAVALLSTEAQACQAHERPGHEVLEIAVRHPSKTRAITEVRRASGTAGVLFVGDDVTDEEVFERLDPPAVTVKVGPGPTAASYRVAEPAQVVLLLARLAGGSSGRPRRPDVG